jgi:enoyl-CoA hydratase
MRSDSQGNVTTEGRGQIFLIGLDRPAKMNAFDLPLLAALSYAFTEFDHSEQYRCAVLFAHGDHFTAGLDLANVTPALQRGEPFVPAGLIDHWGVSGPMRSKPLVAAVHGRCLTIGIELLLASDVRVAAGNALFGQIEIRRGIFPFGGATLRMFQEFGWGNAMRYLLTGDEFNADEALRLGLVQEIVPVGQQLDRAIEIAETIAAQAPLGVRATLLSARKALIEGQEAARSELPSTIQTLLQTTDAQEGVRSFIERRTAHFIGS